MVQLLGPAASAGLADLVRAGPGKLSIVEMTGAFLPSYMSVALLHIKVCTCNKWLFPASFEPRSGILIFR
jgi:hypothetical protein